MSWKSHFIIHEKSKEKKLHKKEQKIFLLKNHTSLAIVQRDWKYFVFTAEIELAICEKNNIKSVVWKLPPWGIFENSLCASHCSFEITIKHHYRDSPFFICHHSRARLKIIRKCHNIFIAEMIPNIRASMKSKKWKRFEDIEAPQSKARECKWNFDYDDSSSRIVKCLRLQLLQHRW